VAIKVGTDDRKKVAIAASLGLVALLLAAHTIFGGPDTPTPPAPQPVPVSATPDSAAPSRSALSTGLSAASPGAATRSGAPGTSTLDPTLHPELMAENEAFVYRGNGRNIFSMNSAPAPMPASIERVKAPIRPLQVAQAPAGPPPPPTIDLKFFGYEAKHNGTRSAFLLHGDDVFIAQEGDVVSHRYRVVKIANTSVTVEDLPYHNTQSLPLVLN
jgi:hypothetical protein